MFEGKDAGATQLRTPTSLAATRRPPAGRRYADRAQRAPGMIHAGDAVVRAFAAASWAWGGSWRMAHDYQHFSASGR